MSRGGARIVVLDSVLQCAGRVEAGDVVVAGSFAGAFSLRLALPFGLRALIAHAAGVGKDQAGISALPTADEPGLAAAAGETLSARLVAGATVHDAGVIAHVNATAQTLGVHVGMTAREAARVLTRAQAPRLLHREVVDRRQHVVEELPAGRVVCIESLSFAEAGNTTDVLCGGSHAGRVNIESLLGIVQPRGVIANDGGMAMDRSGVSGLARLDAAGVAGAAVDAKSARIGGARRTWAGGGISAGKSLAAGRGGGGGPPARGAGRTNQ